MNKRGNFSLTVIFSAVAALLTVVGLLIYLLDMSDNIKEQAYDHLAESALSQKAALNGQINGQYAILESFSAIISTYRDININQITLQMEAIVASSNFSTAAYITADGTAYLSTGTTVAVPDRGYFQRGMEGGRAIEYIEDCRVAGCPAIVLSVPIARDGETVGVVAGCYNRDSLAQLINLNVYHGQGYSLVIRADGDVIVAPPDDTHPSSDYDNIYDFYRDARFAGGVNADDIIALIGGGESGTFEYTGDGLKRYSTYMPLDVADWHILNVVPAEIVDETLNSYTTGAFLLTVMVIMLAAVIILVFGLEERRKNQLLAEEKERLFRSDELYRRVQEMSDSLLFECRPRSHEMRVTSDYRSTLGDIIGDKRATTMEELEGRVYAEDRQVWRDMLAAYDGGAANADIEVRLLLGGTADKHSSGLDRRASDYEPVWFRMRYRVLTGSAGEPYRVIGKFNNIDAAKRSMALLAFRAERDSLTGLYNHKSFIDRVDDIILSKPEASHALLLMDIDYFKRVNDTYGHNSGDAALTGFAAVITAMFRESDVIGRLGGDEIAVFMRDIAEINKVAEKAAEINRYLIAVRPDGVDDDFAVTVSIGIAVCPRDGRSFDKLYLNADSALYEAKRRGRKQYVFYGRE